MKRVKFIIGLQAIFLAAMLLFSGAAIHQGDGALGIAGVPTTLRQHLNIDVSDNPAAYARLVGEEGKAFVMADLLAAARQARAGTPAGQLEGQNVYTFTHKGIQFVTGPEGVKIDVLQNIPEAVTLGDAQIGIIRGQDIFGVKASSTGEVALSFNQETLKRKLAEYPGLEIRLRGLVTKLKSRPVDATSAATVNNDIGQYRATLYKYIRLVVPVVLPAPPSTARIQGYFVVIQGEDQKTDILFIDRRQGAADVIGGLPVAVVANPLFASEVQTILNQQQSIIAAQTAVTGFLARKTITISTAAPVVYGVFRPITIQGVTTPLTLNIAALGQPKIEWERPIGNPISETEISRAVPNAYGNVIPNSVVQMLTRRGEPRIYFVLLGSSPETSLPVLLRVNPSTETVGRQTVQANVIEEASLLVLAGYIAGLSEQAILLEKRQLWTARLVKKSAGVTAPAALAGTAATAGVGIKSASTGAATTPPAVKTASAGVLTLYFNEAVVRTIVPQGSAIESQLKEISSVLQKAGAVSAASAQTLNRELTGSRNKYPSIELVIPMLAMPAAETGGSGYFAVIRTAGGERTLVYLSVAQGAREVSPGLPVAVTVSPVTISEISEIMGISPTSPSGAPIRGTLLPKVDRLGELLRGKYITVSEAEPLEEGLSAITIPGRQQIQTFYLTVIEASRKAWPTTAVGTVPMSTGEIQGNMVGAPILLGGSIKYSSVKSGSLIELPAEGKGKKFYLAVLTRAETFTGRKISLPVLITVIEASPAAQQPARAEAYLINTTSLIGLASYLTQPALTAAPVTGVSAESVGVWRENLAEMVREASEQVISAKAKEATIAALVAGQPVASGPASLAGAEQPAAALKAASAGQALFQIGPADIKKVTQLTTAEETIGTTDWDYLRYINKFQAVKPAGVVFAEPPADMAAAKAQIENILYNQLTPLTAEPGTVKSDVEVAQEVTGGKQLVQVPISAKEVIVMQEAAGTYKPVMAQQQVAKSVKEVQVERGAMLIDFDTLGFLHTRKDGSTVLVPSDYVMKAIAILNNIKDLRTQDGKQRYYISVYSHKYSAEQMKNLLGALAVPFDGFINTPTVADAVADIVQSQQIKPERIAVTLAESTAKNPAILGNLADKLGQLATAVQFIMVKGPKEIGDTLSYKSMLLTSLKLLEGVLTLDEINKLRQDIEIAPSIRPLTIEPDEEKDDAAISRKQAAVAV